MAKRAEAQNHYKDEQFNRVAAMTYREREIPRLFGLQCHGLILEAGTGEIIDCSRQREWAAAPTIDRETILAARK